MNLINSISKYILSGFSNTTDEQRKERAGICSACEYNTGKRCSLCKCFLAPKICMASESCPDNRWERVDGKKTLSVTKKRCKGCGN